MRACAAVLAVGSVSPMAEGVSESKEDSLGACGPAFAEGEAGGEAAVDSRVLSSIAPAALTVAM